MAKKETVIAARLFFTKKAIIIIIPSSERPDVPVGLLVGGGKTNALGEHTRRIHVDGAQARG